MDKCVGGHEQGMKRNTALWVQEKLIYPSLTIKDLRAAGFELWVFEKGSRLRLAKREMIVETWWPWLCYGERRHQNA